MKVVTASMRDRRRDRRLAERALRGAPPRRRAVPRPSGLRRAGWTHTRLATPPPPPTVRVLGAGVPVVLIADRAQVVLSARTFDATALRLRPAVHGPMPSHGASLAPLLVGEPADEHASPPPTSPVEAVTDTTEVTPPVAPVAAAATSPDTAPPETAAPDTTAAETTAPDAAAPETTALDTTAPETTALDTTAPETAARETPAPDTAADAAPPAAPEVVGSPDADARPAPAPADIETSPAVPAALAALTAEVAVAPPAAAGTRTSAAEPAPPVQVAPPATTAPASATPPPVPAPPSGAASPRSTPPATSSPPAPMPSDLLAHALGLSPANTPAPPRVAAPEPRRLERRRRDQQDPRRRGRLLLAAAGVAILAGAGTAVGFAVTGNHASSGGSAAATTGPAAVTGTVASWLSGNISSDRRIVSADATLAGDLNADGVPVDTIAVTDEPRVGVVVVSPESAAPAAVEPVGSTSTLVLLAAFGSGDTRFSVGQVVQGGTEQIRSQIDASAKTASAACAGLVDNAALTIDPAVKPVFESGDLDLRASALLAILAQGQKVEVVAAPQDAAEHAAGRPVRTVVVKVDRPADVRVAATSARAPYAADVDTPSAGINAPGGSLVLSWPIDAAASLSVG